MTTAFLAPRGFPTPRRALHRTVQIIFLSIFGPAGAWAHSSDAIPPEQIWSAWAWAGDPWALLGLGLAAWAYATGVRRLWRRAGVGRGIRRWRFYCYCAGLAMLFIALVSPLDALGGTLFSAHMVQHELLIVAAAPLLVLGTPFIAFAWALPRRWQQYVGSVTRTHEIRTAWRWLTHPAAAWLLHALAIWVWHVPGLYQRTLESPVVHTLQHLSFFGTALLFWWALLRPGKEQQLSPALAVLYLFATAVYGTVLGALLTFSPVPWYPAYGDRPALWGLSLLEDQQLGGLIMWIPFGVLYTVAALAILGRWLNSEGGGAPARSALSAD